MADNKNSNKDEFRADRFTWGKDDIKFIPPEKNTQNSGQNKNK